MNEQPRMNGRQVAAVTALLLASACAMAAEDKPAKVFLLGGQSNMVGMGQPSELTAPYNQPLERVKIWSGKTGKWEPLSPEAIECGSKFGPEIVFGHALAQRYPDADLRLIKYAASGTALYNDWSPVSRGPQYVAFMKTARTALADLDATGRRYEMAGMLWLQGESDASEGQAAGYETNLTAFIAHMREQFKTPGMPFILARVRGFYGGKTGQATIVREAQVKVAESTPHAAWFDTDDCSLINEGHYNTAGLAVIGQRFADKYGEVAARPAPP